MSNDTEGGAEAASVSLVDQFRDEQAQFENDNPDMGTDEGGAEAAAPVEADVEAPAKAETPLDPLPPEEVEKRWRNLDAALKQERNEKRALKNELAELKQHVEQLRAGPPQHQTQRQAVEARLAEYANVDWALLAAQNPEGYNEHRPIFDALTAENQRLEGEAKTAEQQSQQEAQQRAVQTIVNTVQEQEAEFKQSHPDYEEATIFLKQEMASDLRRQGFLDPAQVEQIVMGQMLQIGHRLYAQGADIAEFAYNLAKERGFKGAQPETKQPDIASIQQGQEAAKTLSDVAPRNSNEGGSMEETIANLSGAALKSYWAKVKRGEA